MFFFNSFIVKGKSFNGKEEPRLSSTGSNPSSKTVDSIITKDSARVLKPSDLVVPTTSYDGIQATPSDKSQKTEKTLRYSIVSNTGERLLLEHLPKTQLTRSQEFTVNMMNQKMIEAKEAESETSIPRYDSKSELGREDSREHHSMTKIVAKSKKSLSHTKQEKPTCCGLIQATRTRRPSRDDSF